MDETIENLEIYSAILTFNKKLDRVRVSLRFLEKSRPKKLDFFGIDDFKELKWSRYRNEIISTYHRNSKGGYLINGIQAPENLNQRLESLVHQAYELFANKN